MLVGTYLFWGALQDFRKRKIRTEYLWIGGIAGSVYTVIEILKGNNDFVNWIIAMIPGVIILIIAKYTKEKIGFGDGWVFIILGNFLTVTEIWYVLQTAVFLTTLFSLILIFSKKASKEYQIPFLPFLLAAYLILKGLRYV